MKIEIKCRFGGSVLFSHEAEDNTTRLTLEAAVSARANLYGANLYGANLDGANLDGASLVRANLDGANLYGANLYGANLYGASLVRANLDGANLYGASLVRANLYGANLYGANLDGASLVRANLDGANLYGAKIKDDCTLVGGRPIFQIGPIGSRCAYFVAYITNKGLRFDAGCQRQITREVFESRLQDSHGDNTHAKEYKAALALIDIHAELWSADNKEE
jgi:uncharacterized protein YjbI with pentapeptide repeats